jgi:hypothetical protein
MSKKIVITFTTEAEKEAAIAESKEKTLVCETKSAECLANLEAALIDASQV